MLATVLNGNSAIVIRHLAQLDGDKPDLSVREFDLQAVAQVYGIEIPYEVLRDRRRRRHNQDCRKLRLEISYHMVLSNLHSVGVPHALFLMLAQRRGGKARQK